MNTQAHTFEFIDFPDEAFKQQVKERIERFYKGQHSGHPNNESCKPLKPLAELILDLEESVGDRHFIDLEKMKESSNRLYFTYDYPGLDCGDQEGLQKITIVASKEYSWAIRYVSVDPEKWDSRITWNVTDPFPGFKFNTNFSIFTFNSDPDRDLDIVGPYREYELK